ILETIRTSGAPPLFMQEPFCWSIDQWVVKRAAELGLPHHNDLNSGLLWIPRGSLDTALVERFLETWRPEDSYRVAEQTLLAVLWPVNGPRALPRDESVVSNDAFFFWTPNRIVSRCFVARHFVGNVRHLLYRTGWPLLLKESRQPIP